jgi:hypothetical protein
VASEGRYYGKLAASAAFTSPLCDNRRVGDALPPAPFPAAFLPKVLAKIFPDLACKQPIHHAISSASTE